MTNPRPGSFRARRAALAQLANKQLLFQVNSLVGRERKLEVDVLFHLIEVEGRRLHLDLGFPSMFQYCVDGLGYPRATAARRMKVARCLRDSSRAASLLEAGDVSLGVLYLVARVLTSSNGDDVLARIRGKTESEVESILAEFGGPAPKIRERVVRIPSTERASFPPTLTLYDQPDGTKAAAEPALVEGAPTLARTATRVAAPAGEAATPPGTATYGEPATPPGTATPGGTAAGGGAPGAGSVPNSSEAVESVPSSTQEPLNGSQPGSSAPDSPSSSAPQTPEPDSAHHLHESPATRPREEYRLVAVIDEQTRRKLERALALQSRGRATPASIAETLGAALDRYLSENCPIERDKRRKARKEQQEAKRSGVTQSSASEQDSNAAPSARHSARSSRPYIPIAIRDAVVARDEGRCTFVGPEGRRCTATENLDLDHRLPIALGGNSSIDNLRILCRRHNQREADRLLGRSFMDERRTKGRAQSQTETRREPLLVDR